MMQTGGRQSVDDDFRDDLLFNNTQQGALL